MATLKVAAVEVREISDPRIDAARARLRAFERMAAEATKDFDKTLAHVSPVSMLAGEIYDRERPVHGDKLPESSVLRHIHRPDRRTGKSGLASKGSTPDKSAMVEKQRADFRGTVAHFAAKGLEPPRDYYGEMIGDDVVGAMKALSGEATEAKEDSAASAAAVAVPPAEETEDERIERVARERALKRMMKGEKRGAKPPEGPHLVDHVKKLRQFASASGLPTSETRAHYAMDEEMGRMLRTQDHTYKLKRNQFTEFAEALGRANPKKEGGGGKAAAGGGGGGGGGGGKAKAGK